MTGERRAAFTTAGAASKLAEIANFAGAVTKQASRYEDANLGKLISRHDNFGHPDCMWHVRSWPHLV